MLKYILIPVLTGVLNISACTQTPGLKLGDKMPDILLGKFLDTSGQNIRFSEIKAKLIVLDFWNIHCAICIANMPKMDSIQKTFNGLVKLFAITSNTEKEVRHLFERFRTKKPSIPMIIQDSVFTSLFPHSGDPLHIWINEKGIIVAITFYYNTNFETIGKFLNGIDPQLSRRWDFGFNSDYDLISEQNSGLLNLTSNYSALFRELDQFVGENYIRISDDRIQIINTMLLPLYGLAYNNEVFGFAVDNFRLTHNTRIILKVRDNFPFFPPSDETKLAEWIKQYEVSYELKFSVEKRDLKFKYLQEDLSRFFPFKATIEKRKVKCLVLINFSDGARLKVNDSSSKKILKEGPDSILIHNMPITSLIAQLIYSNPQLEIPIVDETNFDFNINIKLRCNLSNIQSLNKELNSFGLKLVEKEKEIDMLVITD